MSAGSMDDRWTDAAPQCSAMPHFAARDYSRVLLDHDEIRAKEKVYRLAMAALLVIDPAIDIGLAMDWVQSKWETMTTMAITEATPLETAEQKIAVVYKLFDLGHSLRSAVTIMMSDAVSYEEPDEEQRYQDVALDQIYFRCRREGVEVDPVLIRLLVKVCHAYDRLSNEYGQILTWLIMYYKDMETDLSQPKYQVGGIVELREEEREQLPFAIATTALALFKLGHPFASVYQQLLSGRPIVLQQAPEAGVVSGAGGGDIVTTVSSPRISSLRAQVSVAESDSGLTSPSRDCA